MEIYKFRSCLLHTGERSVLRDSKPLDLTTKTFDVLQFLIENRGRVVTKDEILGTVWNGNIVEESNLPVHISKLRKTLGETRTTRFIETVQGTGYRFVAPVQTGNEDEWQIASADSHSLSYSSTAKRSLSIAVLPLENESCDPKFDYLADGLTEGLINGLSHLTSLRVVARNTVFQYKNVETKIEEVANALGVTNVLTGRIRIVGDRLLVGIELIKSEDATQLWGSQYDRPFTDIVNLQHEIVDAIAKNLERIVIRGSAIVPPVENAESYRCYLKGRYFLFKRTASGIHKGIEYFRKSVSFCPTNVHSHTAIVDAYHFLYVLDRMSRIETLINIKPTLEILSSLNQSVDVVQLMKGKLKLHLDWNSRAAETHFRNALVLNPNLVEAHSFYAEIMVLRGKPMEAIYHVKQTLVLDPLSSYSFRQVGRTFYKLGQYENACPYLKDALEMEPADFEALLLLGAVYTELGDYDRALQCLTVSFENHPTLETLSMIGYVQALTGRIDEAERIIGRIGSEFIDYKGHEVNLARINLAMGREEKAYRFLDEAFQQHDLDMYALAIDPRWKKIRTEPRFIALIRRVENAIEAL